MEEVFGSLYRFFLGIFQWALIYSIFITIGSSFIWLVSLGKYPDKRMLVKHDTEMFFLGLFVVIGFLYLTYEIYMWMI